MNGEGGGVVEEPEEEVHLHIELHRLARKHISTRQYRAQTERMVHLTVVSVFGGVVVLGIAWLPLHWGTFGELRGMFELILPPTAWVVATVVGGRRRRKR